jgi:hypothetical protein
MFHNRTNYIKIENYNLHDKVQKREVVLQYISIDEKITNILVKPLSEMKSLQVGDCGDEFLIGKGRDYS